MSLQPKPSLTFDDWLAAERGSMDSRSEYVDGEIFAMTGGTEQHNLIAANVIGELRSQLKGRPCRVYTSDMKIRTPTAEAGFYPDVLVVCGERQFHDDRRDVLTNPALIVEVLSDSTEAYDRGDKFVSYRGLPSLQAYLLIAQNCIRVELYVRQPDDTWNLSTYSDPRDQIPLTALDAALPLAEIYDKTDL
ncbi:Uma2 family endonuclease [Thiorhodococcus mannitoliphagus]|uniref:Uma2 family endonuclease n=1 Tax=Thiorhodococcus mannitoliphagus TaxID=329406 RepID=A0A6P1E0C8_9GAMM|nr:Uma2 family endonuclease [Thiorhodococcus mannitoliphagus]NEX21454.1 Uma2 family endonuclease [Thiorhodococcus mannitoliphagus]